MDGVSGASAIFTITQVGLSLATTLNTYVADVRNGRDDITNLANEIGATVIHIQELNNLIEGNSRTWGWSDNGLLLAKKCCTECEKVLIKLRVVFCKSGAVTKGDNVTRDEIDISIFDRLSWPLLKPRLAVLRQELQMIKIDILIALNTYKAHVGYGFIISPSPKSFGYRRTNHPV
jgi:hypothetical protein